MARNFPCFSRLGGLLLWLVSVCLLLSPNFQEGGLESVFRGNLRLVTFGNAGQSSRGRRRSSSPSSSYGSDSYRSGSDAESGYDSDSPARSRRRRRSSARRRTEDFVVDLPRKTAEDHLKKMIAMPAGTKPIVGAAPTVTLESLAVNADAFFCQCGCVSRTFNVDRPFAVPATGTVGSGPKFGVEVRAIPFNTRSVAADLAKMASALPLQRVMKRSENDVLKQIMEFAAVIAIESPPYMTIEQRKEFLNINTNGEYSKLQRLYDLTKAEAYLEQLRNFEKRLHVDVQDTEPHIYMQSDPGSMGKSPAAKLAQWNVYCSFVCLQEAILDPQMARAQNHIEFAVFKLADDPYRYMRNFSDEPLHIGYRAIEEPSTPAEEALLEFRRKVQSYWYPFFSSMAKLTTKQAVTLEKRQLGGMKMKVDRTDGTFIDGDSVRYYSGGGSYGGSSASRSTSSRSSGSRSASASSSSSYRHSSMLQLASSDASYGSDSRRSRRSRGSSSDSSRAYRRGSRRQGLMSTYTAPEASDFPVVFQCEHLATDEFERIGGSWTSWSALANEGVVRNPDQLYEESKRPPIYVEGDTEGVVRAVQRSISKQSTDVMGVEISQPQRLAQFGVTVAPQVTGAAVVQTQSAAPQVVPLFDSQKQRYASTGGAGVADPEGDFLILVEKPVPYRQDEGVVIDASKEIVEWIRTTAKQTIEDWPKTKPPKSPNVLTFAVSPVFKMKTVLVRDPQDGSTRVSSAFFGRPSTSKKGMFEFLNLDIDENEQSQYKDHHNQVMASWLIPVIKQMGGPEILTLGVHEGAGNVVVPAQKKRLNIVEAGHLRNGDSGPGRLVVNHLAGGGKPVHAIGPAPPASPPATGMRGQPAVDRTTGGSRRVTGAVVVGNPSPGRRVYVGQAVTASGTGNWIPGLVAPINLLQLGASDSPPALEEHQVAKYDIIYDFEFTQACWRYYQNSLQVSDRLVGVARPKELLVYPSDGSPVRSFPFEGMPPKVIQVFSGKGINRIITGTRPEFSTLMNQYHKRPYGNIIDILKKWMGLGTKSDLFERNTCGFPRQPGITVHSYSLNKIEFWRHSSFEGYTTQSVVFPNTKNLEKLADTINQCFGRALPGTVAVSTADPSYHLICYKNEKTVRYAFFKMPGQPGVSPPAARLRSSQMASGGNNGNLASSSWIPPQSRPPPVSNVYSHSRMDSGTVSRGPPVSQFASHSPVAAPPHQASRGTSSLQTRMSSQNQRSEMLSIPSGVGPSIESEVSFRDPLTGEE